jgi:hypothetical protein
MCVWLSKIKASVCLSITPRRPKADRNVNLAVVMAVAQKLLHSSSYDGCSSGYSRHISGSSRVVEAVEVVGMVAELCNNKCKVGDFVTVAC